MKASTTRFLLLLAALPLAAREYDVKQFGAKGDFQTNDRATIQAAIDACNHDGGGTVNVPAGRYFSGGLVLRSHVILRLDAGATIFASRKKEDYPRQKGFTDVYATLITADGAEDIGITGTGVLDGQSPEDLGARFGVPQTDTFRTGIILFLDCRRVTLRDFHIHLSDIWTVTLRQCDTVVIDGVSIVNNPRRINSDGIDPVSCRNVHISNVHVVAGDDALDIKTEGGQPLENVVVTNCTLESTATGLKVGTGTNGDLRDVHFSNITVKAPTGIGFYMNDGGTLERATFSNITLEIPPFTYRGVQPIFMDIQRRNPNSRLSHIRDIAMRDIFITGGSGILIQGMPESHIQNLSLSNISFRVPFADAYDKRSKAVGGSRTTKDERDTKYARMPSYMTLAYVDGLVLDGIRIEQEEEAAAKYERSSVWIEEAMDVMMRGIRCTPPRGKTGLPVVMLHDVDRVLVTGSMALPGTGTFLQTSGNASHIVATGNNLELASADH